MKLISTSELVQKLKLNKNRMFEVAIIKNIFRFTHFISFDGKLLYDTGIDSQIIKWKPEEFLDHYNAVFWQIDQII